MVTAGLFPVSQSVQQLSGPPAGGAGTRVRDSGIRGGGPGTDPRCTLDEPYRRPLS